MTKIGQPERRETKYFCRELWEKRQEYSRKVEWLINMKMDYKEKEPEAEIHLESLRGTLKKIVNWKAPGLNGIHGFWFKRFTSIPDRLAQQLHKCLQEKNLPECMTKGKTTQKDLKKETLQATTD